MLRNIYAPLSGAKAMERKIELISNNIANANTTGFKEDLLSFSSDEANPWPSYGSQPLPPAPFKMDMNELFPLRGNEMQYSVVSKANTNFGQGGIRQTHNPLDVAIQGDGFFAIQTPFGERFSRDGGFTLSREGTLITREGALVLGERGAISGLNSGGVKILPGGEVYQNGEFVDKIRVSSFTDRSLLQKVGSNMFVHDGPPSNFKQPVGELTQGALESSNTNAVRAMSDLIIAHRTYESLQKTVKAHDKSMEISSSRIGEVR